MDALTFTAYMDKEEKLIAAEEAARKRLHAAVRAEKVAHKALVRARARIWDDSRPKEEALYAAALAETKAAASAAVAATRAMVDNQYAWVASLTK